MRIYLTDEDGAGEPVKSKRTSNWGKIAALVTLGILSVGTWGVSQLVKGQVASRFRSLPAESCPVGETIRPLSFYEDRSSTDEILFNYAWRNKSLDIFTGAVKISTVVQDDMPDPNTHPEAWSNFTRFHNHLEKSFPLVHSRLRLEKVNVFGLLYTWEGSDPNLKPLLLTAHQDVVPVLEPTLKDWKYPPFSGHFDGERIWGRGSSDDKSLLIADLAAVEKLLSEGFQPKRTIVLSFGFDEERGGEFGAKSLAGVLNERYGEDSFYALVDEGVGTVEIVDDRAITVVAIGEKGSINLEISLTTPGGHSSVPPSHTNIGLVSKLISYIEDHPFKASLGPGNPVLYYLQCLAEHTNVFDKQLKKHIFKAGYDTKSNAEVVKYLSEDPVTSSSVKTTQAIDIINGGIKSNALPEFVSFVINHRINVESSVNETIEQVLSDIKVLSKEYNLGILLNDEEILPKTENGYFVLNAGEGLEPAKVSPREGEVWAKFSGSIKHIVEDYIHPDLEKPSVVAGTLMTGNTDTRYYWPLTDNIYRFMFSTTELVKTHIHSVNEYTTLDDHLFIQLFVYEFIQSVNE